MQVCDADFYPAEKGKNKKLPLFKMFIALLCAVMAVLLGIRLLSWVRSSRDTELLSLVNRWNSVEGAQFRPRLCEIPGGLRADRRCRAELEKMLSDCRGAGGKPEIIAAYRSFEEQQKLYGDEIRRREILGMSTSQAQKMAQDKVDRPGYSEHELGLAFDICQKGAEGDADSETVSWLMENSWRYGFVLRYPVWAEAVTGRRFQPFHYRYVGKEAAAQMWDMKICLEDYIEMFYSSEANIIEQK